MEQVRQFYDQIGWMEVSEGVYQNARYEDLRSVSREYIHRCHMRVNSFLDTRGRFFLDAGSGPIQYPEYLSYSQYYDFRVCLDISYVALLEARKRIRQHGLFVVADVAKMPFKNDAFDGIVSLHTLHHLPFEEQKKSYSEFFRVLASKKKAVVVNGWPESVLMRLSMPFISVMEWMGGLIAKISAGSSQETVQETRETEPENGKPDPQGTYIRKLDFKSLEHELNGKMDFKIYSWRSVSVRFLRAFVHRILGGRYLLRLLFLLEERYPRFFGEKGQYPLLVIRKP